MIWVQPGSQLAQCVFSLSDSFYCIQSTGGLCFLTRDEDKGSGGSVMMKLWEMGGEEAWRRFGVVDVAQG